MTTLHEEPSSRHTLTEEVEENYSDSELNHFHDDSAVRKPPLKSRFPTSKTMGSLRDIGNNFQLMSSSTSNANNVTKNVRKNATNAANKQASGTPSMTSSTSSGYGSQVQLNFSDILKQLLLAVSHLCLNLWYIGRKIHSSNFILSYALLIWYRLSVIVISQTMTHYRFVRWVLMRLQVNLHFFILTWFT